MTPVSAINEGSGALTFVEVVDGNLEVRDGRRIEIYGAVWVVVEMWLLRQSLLRWGVGELVEVDDTVDVVFRKPVDGGLVKNWDLS